MELGAMTAAACEPGSLADQMANMFGPAQNYRFEVPEMGPSLNNIWDRTQVDAIHCLTSASGQTTFPL